MTLLQNGRRYFDWNASSLLCDRSRNSLISNLEIVEMIGQHLNREYDYILTSQDPTRPKHDFKYGLDNSLIRSLGAEFDRDFDMGLKQTVDWYTANPIWLG